VIGRFHAAKATKAKTGYSQQKLDVLMLFYSIETKTEAGKKPTNQFCLPTAYTPLGRSIASNDQNIRNTLKIMTLPTGVTAVSYPGTAVQLDGLKTPKTVVLGLANHAAHRNSFTEFFHFGKHHDAKELIQESEVFLKAAANHIQPGDTLHLVYVVTSAEMGRHDNIRLGNDPLRNIGKLAEEEWATKIRAYLPSGINVATTVIRAPYQAEGLVAVSAVQTADMIIASEAPFPTERDYLWKHSLVPVVIVNSVTGACQRYNGTGILGWPSAVEQLVAAKASGREINDVDHSWTSSVEFYNKGVDQVGPHVRDDLAFDKAHKAEIEEAATFNH